MKILKRHYEKPTMQVYEIRETPRILADSSGLNDYDKKDPLNW